MARFSAILMFVAVSLGAIGAHLLKDVLEANGRTGTWGTATLYFLVHATVLFALSWQRDSVPKGPFWAFVLGILLFSGSLYALSVTNIGVFGAITMFGGLSFLTGWAWLAIKAR